MARVPFDELNLRRISETLHRLGRKRVGEVTLTANAAATVVTDLTITETCGVTLLPRTVNAAAEQHSSPFCLVTVSRGSFSIAHNNNAQTDRTFFWFAVGD